MKTTTKHKDEWLAARLRLLEAEKELTRHRDTVTRLRQQLPWLKVEKDYRFVGPEGSLSLGQLFSGCSQLIVYHFMFGPDWEQGCKSCSFWADNFDGVMSHLNARDTHLVAVSRAPLKRLLEFRHRMGWAFDWVSSETSDFNYDYQVSFTNPSEPVYYNFRTTQFPSEEAPGLSVFTKNQDGHIFHSYSCYARGLDPLNSAYQLLDLVPKGRDEQGLSHSMAWLKLKDEY